MENKSNPISRYQAVDAGNPHRAELESRIERRVGHDAAGEQVIGGVGKPAFVAPRESRADTAGATGHIDDQDRQHHGAMQSAGGRRFRDARIHRET